MEQRHPVKRPPLEEFLPDLAQARSRELLPSLVRQAGDEAGGGVIPNRAEEHAGAAHGCASDEVERFVRRDRALGDPDQEAVGHGPIVGSRLNGAQT